jgi:hypothetical protein
VLVGAQHHGGEGAVVGRLAGLQAEGTAAGDVSMGPRGVRGRELSGGGEAVAGVEAEQGASDPSVELFAVTRLRL